MNQNKIAPVQGACYSGTDGRRLSGLSVALCCLNERPNLPEVIQRMKGLEKSLGEGLHEVVVVDGGSTDGSWELLEQAAAGWSKLKPLRQQQPRGYGSGYRQSVLACSGDLIVTCDTDLNYDMTEVVRMLPLLSEADLVVANPFLRGAKAWLGPSRMLLTHGVALLYRLVLAGRPGVGTTFTPILRVGKADLFKKAAPRSNGFTASAEFMMRVYLTAGVRVVETPISVHHRGAGVSKMHKLSNILSHLRLMGRVAAFRMGLRKEL